MIFTHTVYTGVSSNVPGYDSSIVMILSQISTVNIYLPVRHWITAASLTPLSCVCNFKYTFFARYMQPLLCSILRRFLYNLISPFRRMRVHLFSPLGVVEYSHEGVGGVLQLFSLWMCSCESAITCKWGTLAFPGWSYCVSWWGLLICIPVVPTGG